MDLLYCGFLVACSFMWLGITLLCLRFQHLAVLLGCIQEISSNMLMLMSFTKAKFNHRGSQELLKLGIIQNSIGSSIPRGFLGTSGVHLTLDASQGLCIREQIFVISTPILDPSAISRSAGGKPNPLTTAALRRSLVVYHQRRLGQILVEQVTLFQNGES
jgi:hypothetical protein